MSIGTIGYHYVVEASGCNPEEIATPNRVRDTLLEAARLGQMEVKTSNFFRFTPEGVSGVVIIAESHISIHTWPENRYAAVDVYVCGERSEPEKAIEFILQRFGAGHAHISEIKRGLEYDGEFTHQILTWEEEPAEPQ